MTEFFGSVHHMATQSRSLGGLSVLKQTSSNSGYIAHKLFIYMKNIFIPHSSTRSSVKKFLAFVLMFAMNLSVGGLGVFLLPSATSAAVVSTTIFSSGFESSPIFSDWTSSDTKWTNTTSEHQGAHAAKVNGQTGANNDALTKFASTTGYKDITFSYWYRADDLESRTCTNNNNCSGHDDVVLAQYTLDGTNWVTLDIISKIGSDGQYHEKIDTLPSATADNANFGLRFSANLDAGNDTVRIDDVLLTGTLLENTLARCTDNIDNDGNGLTDLEDPSCAQFRPTLVVVKHVVGGTQKAENFVLQINGGNSFPGNEGGTTFTYNTSLMQYAVTESAAGDYNTTVSPSCSGTLVAGQSTTTCTVTNSYDVCANIAGNQTSVPPEDMRDGNNCIPKSDPTPVPPSQPGQCIAKELTIISDGTNTVEENNNAFATGTYVHPNWVAAIPGVPTAIWIWQTYFVEHPAQDETKTFDKNIVVNGSTTGATLTIAMDNSFVAWLNGVEFASSSNEVGYSATRDYTVPAALFVKGTNTLRVSVKNWSGNADPQLNPAGLLYRLTVNEEECPIQVHITKYIGEDHANTESADDASFPMHASWNAGNTGTGSGDYTLNSAGYGGGGAYEAVTAFMSIPADYATNEMLANEENDNAILSPNAACIPDHFRLEGYKWGDTLDLALASATSTEAPSFTGLVHDKYVIVYNETCPSASSATGTITLTKVVKGGAKEVSDFPLFVGETSVISGATTTFTASTEGSWYQISENNTAENYTAEFSGDCSMREDGGGHYIILHQGEAKSCTITNTYRGTLPPEMLPTPGSGSAYIDGCTNALATNYNIFANKDDGSCKLPPPPPSTGGSGSITPEGEVLGAATTTEPILSASCTEYLHSYLGYGKKNDPEEVKKLQIFLNRIMGADIPVSGYFGKLTRLGVKKFQVKYHDQILQPWIDAGVDPKELEGGTGYVYKTTLRQINLIECADINISLPKNL